MFDNYQKYILPNLNLYELVDLMEEDYFYPLKYIIYNMCVFINKNKLFSMIFIKYIYIFSVFV